MKRRRALLLSSLVLVASPCVTSQTATATAASEPGTASTQPPDIVIILTDDQRAGTHRAMPFTRRFFSSPTAVDYVNTQIPTNVCCPSRVAFLTGKYPTDTHAWDQRGSFGGARAIAAREKTTMPARLHDVGYRTGLFGKYVNGYGSTARTKSATPFGWDRFHTYTGRRGSNYYGPIRGLPRGYTTDTLGQATSRFVATTPQDQPLFAYYAPFGPHAPYDAGPYRETAGPRLQWVAARGGRLFNPSFNSVTADQPQWLQSLRKVSRDEQRRVAQKQADALMGVDANVARIARAIERHRDLSNTLFIYMSDNGYGWGDHRLPAKRSPYVTTNEVPLLVRYPDDQRPPSPGQDSRLANNVDVTATILTAAGLPNESAGVPLTSTQQRTVLPLMAAPTVGTKARHIPRPAYCGVRTRSWFYLQYGSGEEELYDLTADPWQLRNLAASPPASADISALRGLTTATGCDLDYLQSVVGPQLSESNE